MILLIATTNANKITEMAAVLGEPGVNFKTLADVAPLPAPEETGTTFEENARQKALYYAAATGLVTLAEDSGFEVDALEGEPGVYSARFLRPDATYPERFTAIYDRLRQIGRTTSGARYVCAIALASGSDILFESTGVVNGELAPQPAGSGGFGYDPIFYYPPYGKTFGQASPEQKLAVSHRGVAIRAFDAYIKKGDGK